MTRTITAAAALAAAVAVSTVFVRYRRLHVALRRERAAGRLMNGRLHGDLEAFRYRLDVAVAQRAVVDEAVGVLEDALAHHTRIDPHTEGGPA